MYDSKRTVAVLLAAMTVVGFAVAPSAVVAADDDSLQIDQVTNDTGVQADHGPYPHEICTDLLGMIHEEAPYDMVVWVDDLPESVPRDIPQKDQLPEEVRPPGVPWSVLTPEAVGGIVVGATPNQCDIQDPNDPSWDPTRDGDNLAPDGNADAQPGENGEVLVIVNGTLDNTSEGPATDLEADLELGENGTLDPNARLNDGEKEYGVDPGLQYWPDGTTYFETDVYVLNTRLGVEQDCFGEECDFATRGLPNFVDYPSIPAPSDRERPDSGGDDGSDGSDDSDGSDGSDGSDDAETGGPGADDTTSSDDSDGTDGGDGSDGGDDGSDSSDGSDGSDGNDAGGDGNDGNDGNEAGGNDGEGGSSDADANQQQQSADENQDAQQAAAADGTGLGILVALVVFILGAAAIAPRD